MLYIISCFEADKEGKLRISLTTSHVESRLKHIINTLHFILTAKFKGTIDYLRVYVVHRSCNAK